ncbi:MAG: hypothetical protein JNG85_10940 [Spirochaetaceae bacterium]|nr:hypothetical protein [Spirochaetaceae bacterium]
MRKLELHALNRDLDAVIELIGRARCFQLAESSIEGAARNGGHESAGEGDTARGETAKKVALELAKLRELRDLLDLKAPGLLPEGAKLPGPAEEALLDDCLAGAKALALEVEALESRRARVREALEEARAFSGLSLPFKELDHLSFLSVRIGRVPPGELDSLSSGLQDRALILPLDEEGTIVAAASKKGRFILDTELTRARFKARELPSDFKGLPPELLERLEAEAAGLEAESAALAARKAVLRTQVGGHWEGLSASFAVLAAIEGAKAGLERSESVGRIEGWVPRERVAPLLAELRRATEGRIAARVYAPEELDTVREGRETVPVLLKRRPFVSSFEGLVVSYGAPLYGTIDPTPLVAFFFVVLFAVMFGDLGQGLVILLAGLVLRGGGRPRLAKWKAYGPIFIAVGIGSMVTGFLDGTVFANETLLVPLSRKLSQAILGRPLDRFVQIMPENGSVAKLFAFFGFTVGIGVVINSVGLLVNIANKWRLGKRGEALFSKTGLAGALFFWWAVGLGLRVLLGGGLGLVDLAGFLPPLAAIFLEEPLGRLAEGRRAEGKGDGALSFAIKGFVEVIESIS